MRPAARAAEARCFWLAPAGRREHPADSSNYAPLLPRKLTRGALWVNSGGRGPVGEHVGWFGVVQFLDIVVEW